MLVLYLDLALLGFPSYCSPKYPESLLSLASLCIHRSSIDSPVLTSKNEVALRNASADAMNHTPVQAAAPPSCDALPVPPSLAEPELCAARARMKAVTIGEMIPCDIPTQFVNPVSTPHVRGAISKMFENTPLLVAPEASCEVASRAIMILVEAQNGIHANADASGSSQSVVAASQRRNAGEHARHSQHPSQRFVVGGEPVR